MEIDKTIFKAIDELGALQREVATYIMCMKRCKVSSPKWKLYVEKCEVATNAAADIKSINPAYEFHEVDIVVSATANEQVA